MPFTNEMRKDDEKLKRLQVENINKDNDQSMQ